MSLVLNNRALVFILRLTVCDPAAVNDTLKVPLLMAFRIKLATVSKDGSCFGFKTSPMGGGRSSNVNVTIMSLLLA